MIDFIQKTLAQQLAFTVDNIDYDRVALFFISDFPKLIASISDEVNKLIKHAAKFALFVATMAALPGAAHAGDLPPSEWPNFYFRNGHEGGMEWQGSTSRKISSASCVKRRLCSHRAERLQMLADGSVLPNRVIIAGVKNTAA